MFWKDVSIVFPNIDLEKCHYWSFLINFPIFLKVPDDWGLSEVFWIRWRPNMLTLQFLLQCNNCNQLVIHPEQRFSFFSDYSQMVSCPHCGAQEAHFAKNLPSIFMRRDEATRQMSLHTNMRVTRVNSAWPSIKSCRAVTTFGHCSSNKANDDGGGRYRRFPNWKIDDIA